MSTTQEHSCIFCKESFDNKEDLQIHFRKHGDPKFNQGVKCSKISKESPSQRSGDKSEDVQNEMVSCDVCTDVFPTISKAITHKHKVHPDHDAKYFCPWCGKLFTMKHLYNKHIENNHDGNDQSEDSGFHCDSCEVDFFIPSAMVYHNRFFHRQDTELAVIGHSKKMKLFNQEPLPIYYCPFCGEEYLNKVNLHKHMGDDHSDENQSPDDVLRCPLCEAIFYHLDAYELHLTFHSSDDLYSEENDTASAILEFSLETVPPIMEKVENEVEDGTNTANSVGIEELLQQAMNESNDNDSDAIPEKKKKRKKHKKKKTMTLDEFLNMNKDLFGEGLGDVQGIEEVPTQVVAKQLKPRKSLPRTVSGNKLTPTAEIEKLKMQGIVVKKKLNHPNKFQGIKVMHSKQMNLQNIRANKINTTTPPLQKTPPLSSPNDVLARLQNSQIKIVKTGAQNSFKSESSEIKTPEGAEVDTEKKDYLKTSDDSVSDNIQAASKDEEQIDENIAHHENQNNKLTNTPKNSADSYSQSPKENENSTETVGNRNQPMEEDSESQVASNNKTSEEKCMDSEDHKVTPKLDQPKINSANALNALKNLSQHITIKQMSPSSGLNQQKTSLDKCNDNYETSARFIDEDHIENKKESTDNNATESKQSSSDKKSLNALKHLSHLTVKPVNQNKLASPALVKNSLPDDHNSEEELDIEKCINSSEILKPNKVINTTKENTLEIQQGSPKSLDAMKNISKHVTIKSMKPSPKCAKIVTENVAHESDDDNHVDDYPDLETNPQNGGNVFDNKNINITLPSSVTMKSLKSPAMRSQSPSNSPKSSNRFVGSENPTFHKEVPLKSDATTSQSCTNILKQLPNITAKPFNSIKNVQPQITVNTSKQARSMQKSSVVQKTEEKNEEIEIFNIDDSDEEEMNNHTSNIKENLNHIHTKPVTVSSSKFENDIAISDQKLDTLRNLNKNITIKSTNKPKTTITENFEKFDDDETNQKYYSDDENENRQTPDQKTTTLNNTLKSLGKQITVTASSPKTSGNSRNISIKKEDFKSDTEEYDSEPEMNSQVKITEIDNAHTSDDEFENANTIDSKNVVVQTPDSDSDQENANCDNDDNIETQIKATRMSKHPQSASRKPDCLNNLKNITVKSLKDINFEDGEENDDESEAHDNTLQEKPIIPKFAKEISVKTVKQMKSNSETKTPAPANKNTKQTLSRSTNQSANQKVSTSSDQVNTVNKEVTVKTFQTKTVIQEITTTVTKTIRTVNQEVRNISQNTSTIRPQVIQGMRPQQIKNFKGTHVRQAIPSIRNNRPVVGSIVRPPNQGVPIRGSVTTSNQLVPLKPGTATSHQLVPVRPGTTVRGPRMPVTRKPMPSSTSNPLRPVFGKPLKISPNAMMSTKRSTSEETAGPFSCFKRPKESPIPSFDDNEGPMHFASTSQISRSNFSNTTKTIKDNSVMRSSEIRSEAVSTSTQQISKLSNMSGIKVVKTSQAKQTMHVEEESEVSPAKRLALEAIEKLQKQGLLVKRPRVEEEDSDQDNFDSGDHDDDDCHDNT